MQTTEACPFLPSPYTHHPMKAGATALQNYIATLDYLFISYSSLHCINFLLTSQALLLEKTVWLFLLEKCIYSYTDPHRPLIRSLERERELLAPSWRLLVNAAIWGYSRGEKKSSNCVQILIIHLGTGVQVWLWFLLQSATPCIYTEQNDALLWSHLCFLPVSPAPCSSCTWRGMANFRTRRV